MKKIWVIFIVFAIVAIVVVDVMFFGNSSTTSSSNSSSSSNLPGSSSSSSSSSNQTPGTNSNFISMSDLAKHNNQNDCWVIYQNRVYDLSSWITNHPGGVQAIAQYCGTTGFEQAFIAKHGTTKASFFLKVAVLVGDASKVGSLQ